MKNYIAIYILVNLCVCLQVWGSDASIIDERGFEILVPDSAIPDSLRVELLVGMLHAKVVSFAPYDDGFVTPYERDFVYAIYEVDKYITVYLERKDRAMLTVCIEWLFGRIIDSCTDTEVVLPEIIRILHRVSRVVKYPQRIRDLVAEDAESDDSDDTIVDYSSDESMAHYATNAPDFFEQYYNEQKSNLLAAVWTWTL